MPTTKRHARTLEEAFGPYARGHLEEQYTPMDFVDKLVITVSGILLTVFAIAIFAGAL